MPGTPILDREEYIEQAYFFRGFRERLGENLPSQLILDQIHEEILATTRLPLAIQFLCTELKHTGLLAPGMRNLRHYFTPFQAFVAHQAEQEGLRFSMNLALQILEGEAVYRSDSPTRPGLFIYQFEALSRNRLGYDDGLSRIAEDGFYPEEWQTFIASVQRGIGEVDFADLLYLRSEQYVTDQRWAETPAHLPPPLFGIKEGKIAKASRGRDPIYLFSALQRQLGYPKVPRPKPPAKDSPENQALMMKAKIRELETRLQLLEFEARGSGDLKQFLEKNENE